MTVATPAFLVPRRADDGPRDRLWDFTRTVHWESYAWPIIEAWDEGPHPFNRSRAVNDAEAKCPPWVDMLVIIDADVIVDADRVRQTVRAAHTTGRMTLPFTEWRGVTREGTEQILDGYSGSWARFIHSTYTDSVSACVAVPRDLFREAGGFDERFHGWGLEDSAFAAAAATLGGGIDRLGGDLWHLWHPRDHDGRMAQREANRPLFEPYAGAQGDPVRMRQVIDAAHRAMGHDA